MRSPDARRQLVALAARAAALYARLEAKSLFHLDDDRAAADRLLHAALTTTGHANAYHAGTASEAQRRDILHAVAEHTADELHGLTRAFLAEYPDSTKAIGARFKQGLKEWAGKMRRTIGAGLLAGALALFGPRDLDARDQANLAAARQVQERFLEGFVGAVEAGTQPTDGTMASRAALYGHAVWGAAQALQRTALTRDGTLQFERRVLGFAESGHCHECPELADLGWQPAGVLPPLGSTPCGVRCRCHWEYRTETPPPDGPIAAAASAEILRYEGE